jgi:hypothetical protein
MDPGSARVTAWLGFIDLAPSSATAKEGTTLRVVVPLQPSRLSTGGASCSGTLWRRSHRSEAHRCNQIIEDSGTFATIAGCSAVAARPQQMKQTTLLRRNISEAGHRRRPRRDRQRLPRCDRTVRGGGSRAGTRSIGGGEDRNRGGGVLHVDLTRRRRRRGQTRPQCRQPRGRCRRTRHGQGRHWRPMRCRGRARQERP